MNVCTLFLLLFLWLFLFLFIVSSAYFLAFECKVSVFANCNINTTWLCLTVSVHHGHSCIHFLFDTSRVLRLAFVINFDGDVCDFSLCATISQIVWQAFASICHLCQVATHFIQRLKLESIEDSLCSELFWLLSLILPSVFNVFVFFKKGDNLLFFELKRIFKELILGLECW